MLAPQPTHCATATGHVRTSLTAAIRPRRSDRPATDATAGVGSPATVVETASWTVALRTSRPAGVGADPATGTTVVVHGELSGPPVAPAHLAADVARRGTAAVATGLDGSYDLLVVDPVRDEVTVVTDRTGSRRLFARSGPEGTLVSSELTAHKAGARPDPVGIGWYLANGAVHNGRTTLAEVSVLRPASLHRAVPEGLRGCPYWSFRVGEERSGLGEAALSDALEERLVEAVRRHIADDPDVFLSLSGGFDARTIAGILRFRLGIGDVGSFSYLLGPPRRHRDEDIAARIAAVAGFRHDLVQSYDGDFLASIHDNAALGHGMRHFVHEIDAWKALTPLLATAARPVVLVGDENFGYPYAFPVASPDSALAAMGMRSIDAARAVDARLPDATRAAMRDGIAADMEEMLGRAPRTGSAIDTCDFLYQDQRLVNVVLPWRERYNGHFATVRNPFLDAGVLDLMATVPSELRREKRLFRATAVRMHPELRALPKAKATNYMIDLRGEVARNAGAVRALLEAPSPLVDEVVAPEVGTALLEGVLARRSPSRALKARVTTVVRDALPAGTSGIVHRRRADQPVPRPVDPASLLVRLLILRVALG